MRRRSSSQSWAAETCSCSIYRVGIGILRKAGYTVRNKDFFRIGIPFALAAIIPAYIYFWLVFEI